jgi:hypothetical protein
MHAGPHDRHVIAVAPAWTLAMVALPVHLGALAPAHHLGVSDGVEAAIYLILLGLLLAFLVNFLRKRSR